MNSPKVTVKPNKEVSSDSLQNPSDPDVGYDGHKGKELPASRLIFVVLYHKLLAPGPEMSKAGDASPASRIIKGSNSQGLLRTHRT